MLGVVRFPGLHESQNGLEFFQKKIWVVFAAKAQNDRFHGPVDGLMHNTTFLGLVRTCRGFPIYINLYVPWKIPVDDGIGSPKMMVPQPWFSCGFLRMSCKPSPSQKTMFIGAMVTIPKWVVHYCFNHIRLSLLNQSMDETGEITPKSARTGPGQTAGSC